MIQDLKDKWREFEAQKRAELELSLEQGNVADPFGGTFLLTLAISAAVSAASYVVSRALAPKPPRQQVGKLTGSLQLQNSEQGLFIPEIYGASPATSLVAGSNPTYQNGANITVGANGALTKTTGGSTTWNAGASHNVAINSGDDAFFQFTLGTGYAAAGFSTTSSPVNGNTDFKFGIQWNPDGSVTLRYNNSGSVPSVTTWVTGDVFRVELRSSRFRLYKGSAEIVPPNFLPPTPSYPIYAGVAIQVMGAGITAAKVQINNIGAAPNSGRGGVKVPAIIVWSSGIRKLVTTTQEQTGGGKGGGGRTQTVDNISYDIDLGLMFSRGPLNLIREYANADILIDQYAQSANPSGVYDPSQGADPDYDPTAPPDPTAGHQLPFHRVDGDIPLDGDGVGSGTIQGGGSGFAIYPGNTTQQPDPTIEADIDAKYGSGSTPAYRNHAMTVHTALSLSRWGGVVPNITAVWEHQTLKTLDDIFGALCERVGVMAANSDYDFSGIPIACRGLLIAGRTFAPKEIIGSSEMQCAYNYFVTEAEGQIIAYEEGNEPSVTIPDTEVGWLDGDAEMPDIAPEIETVIASEISLPREVHVKSLDPDSDWEPNTQSAVRQITDGSAVELLEIQITQLSDERRETAQRKLYREYVAGTAHKFTLPWAYLYLYPGYRVTITRAEGFTHVMRLTSVTGGVGLLECEGIALEPEAFTQPATGVFPPGYIPPQAIPAMTVLSLLDTPLLREGDDTENNGIGFYMCGTPRTGTNQNWNGFGLHMNRSGVWSLISSSSLAGTIGTIASTTTPSTDTSIIDRVGHFVIDLYGTTATLSSISEAEMLADPAKNLAVVGDMVVQFASAVQVAGFANRWDLSVLLNGRRGTASHVADSFTGKRFVLIDGAVKFVPMQLSDLNNLMEYRAVTSGQSLGDAATVEFTWTGATKRGQPISNPRKTLDSGNDALIEFEGRTRIGGGLRSNQAGAVNEEAEEYRIQILNAGSTTLPNGRERILTVIPGTQQAAILMGEKGFAGVTHNNFAPISPSIARAVQSVHGPDNFIEGGIVLGSPVDTREAALALQRAGGPSHELTTAFGAAGFSAAGTLTGDLALVPYIVALSYAFDFSDGPWVRISVFEYGSSIFTASNKSDQSDYDPDFGWYSLSGDRNFFRIKFNLVGSTVRIQKAHTLQAPFTTITTGRRAAQYPMFPILYCDGLSETEIKGVTMTTFPFPKTIYSAAQATQDGLTPGAPLQMDIWQHSRLVGEGIKTRVTL